MDTLKRSAFLSRVERDDLVRTRVMWKENIIKTVLTTEIKGDAITYAGNVYNLRMLAAIRKRLAEKRLRLRCISNYTGNVFIVWCEPKNRRRHEPYV